MIAAHDLRARLTDIETSYRTEADAVKALLWAKLAALELGGWTEECIDKIVMDFLDARNPSRKSKVVERLKTVYGFEYGKEFRSLVVELVGVIGFEQIENKIPLKCQQLETALAALKQSRDRCAHTYTKPSMAIDAPTKMIDLLTKIENGLTAFSLELQKIQLQP